MIPAVTRLVNPTAAELAEVAEVFDQYRNHYGEAVVPGQALTWLAQHTKSGMLNIFTAHLGSDLVVCKSACFSLRAVDAGEDLVGFLGQGERVRVVVP